MDRPLRGWTLLLTRPAGRIDAMAPDLEAHGARVIVEPLTRTAPVEGEEAAALDRALGALETYDWLLVTSAEGVRALLARAAARQGGPVDLAAWLPTRLRLAAIGPATAAAAEAAGRAPDLVPAEYRAEGLVRAFEQALPTLRGLRMLLVRAREGRNVVPEALAAAGARVEVVPAYFTVGLPDGAARATALLARGGVDLVVATSGAALEELASAMACLPEVRAGVRVAALGPVTAARARDLGFDVALTAPEATARSLVTALVNHAVRMGGEDAVSR